MRRLHCLTIFFALTGLALLIFNNGLVMSAGGMLFLLAALVVWDELETLKGKERRYEREKHHRRP